MPRTAADAAAAPRAAVRPRQGRHPRPGRAAIPGAADFLADLAARGVPYVVLSNTGTRGGAEVAAELSATLACRSPRAA